MKKTLLLLALAVLPFVSKAGDGLSAETAFTVNEALSASNLSMFGVYWVKGYIVGSSPVNNLSDNPQPYFGLTNATNFGVAIADDAKCTDPKATICTFSFSTSNQNSNFNKKYNLKDNPSALGKYIAIKGNFAGNPYRSFSNIEDFKELQGSQSGIDDIAADNNAPAVYYTLQGVSVKEENLTKGQVYVRVQGNKAEKLVVL